VRRPTRSLFVDVPTRYWLLVLVAYILGYWYSHWRLRMWFGDSLYYTSMTMMRAGHSYADAINQTGAYFHDPNIWRLDHGFSNPAFYDLIKPRVVYVWLSVPFVWLLGPRGMFVIPALAGLVTIYLLIRLLTRFVPAGLATAMVLLVLTTQQFWQFSTGIYTESLCVMFVAMLLVLLPWQGESTRWQLAGVAGLIVLLTFTRQMTVIPMAMVLGGWLWAMVGQRRIRSTWLPVGVTATVVGGLSQVSMMLIAPFNALRQFAANTGFRGNPRGAVLNLPHLALNTLNHEVASYRYNISGLLLWAGALAAGLLLWRTVAAGVYLGGLASSFALDLLNGTMTQQRYLYPVLPACVLILALGIQRFARADGSAMPADTGSGTGTDRPLVPPVELSPAYDT
jgi:hypothetical protein